MLGNSKLYVQSLQTSVRGLSAMLLESVTTIDDKTF
jgi:hypothetical protein